MKLFDWLKRRTENEESLPEGPDLSGCSGMRVEVSDLDGERLFMAKLADLREDHGELHQMSSTSLAQDQEPLPVRVRGYLDEEKRAVCLEGIISPLPRRVWRVERLTPSKTGGDRAFFRLKTNLEATATPPYSPPRTAGQPCRLLDISVGGVRIHTQQVYRKGDRFLLKVRLPDGQESPALRCQVVRTVRRDNGCEYGCRFLDLDESSQDRITRDIFAAQRRTRQGG